MLLSLRAPTLATVAVLSALALGQVSAANAQSTSPTVTFTDATGVAGGYAYSDITFRFDQAFAFTGIDFVLDSAPTMAFDAAASKVNGGSQSFESWLAALSPAEFFFAGGNTSEIDDQGQSFNRYTLNLAYLGAGSVPLAAGESFVVNAAFKLDGNFQGASVTLNNTLYDANEGAVALPALVAAVTAVPEPETWAMLLAGLGVMAGAATRRRSAA